VLLLLLSSGSARDTHALATGDNRFGIDFVNAQGQSFPNQNQRYAEANQAGAGWDRWVIYWSNVEKACDETYDWSGTDPVVNADVAQGLSIDAVLLGTPSCYATASAPRPTNVSEPHGGLTDLTNGGQSVPRDLYAPIFSDGTDIYQPGKTINPGNPWAYFVYTAVARYHTQIHDWEIWNEPDYSAFWSGSVSDYARLLKVAYFAAHTADTSARILVGGMMYWQWANQSGDQAWLKAFLSNVTADPQAAANDDYFDVIPWHWYSRSSDDYTHIVSAASVLATYGVTGKELWINETNAPACGETVNGTAFSCAMPGAAGYATDEEQASFILQALANGFAAGASKVFEFQLQDDGNAQALGMFRNDGTTRQAYVAYQVGEQNLAGFQVARRQTGDGWEAVTFGVPTGNPHRTTVIWNDTGQPVTAIVLGAGAAPTGVQLIQQDGTAQKVTPGSSYALTLPAATDNRNWDGNPNEYIIGGSTYLLVESLPADTTPPTSKVTSAVFQAGSQSIVVKWSGSDPGGWGIADYTIQVRDQTVDANWRDWLLNTANTSGTFTPTPGHVYQFRSLARDWAGNVETKCGAQADIGVSANTARGQPLPYKIYFPLLPSGSSVGC